MTTITLKYPVEFGGATYSELTLKRPNAGVLAKFEAELRERDLVEGLDRVRSSIVLVSLASGLPEDVVNLLDIDDLTAANEALGDFLSSRVSSRGKPRK